VFLPTIKTRSIDDGSKETIIMKAEVLRKTIWRYSIVSAGVAAVPVPGLSLVADLVLIATVAREFYHYLGLDEASILQTCNRLSVDMSKVDLEPIKSLRNRLLTAEGVKELIMSIPTMAFAMSSEEAVRFIPFLGTLVASTISYGTTNYALRYILDKEEELALAIMDQIVNFAIVE